MNYEPIKELKNEIDKYYYQIENCCCDYNSFDEFIESMKKTYKHLDHVVIEYLAKTNKYKIDGNSLYIEAHKLKNEIKEFYKIEKSHFEIFKQHIDWLLHYKNIYMKSDKLYIGMVNQKLDGNILEEMLYNMKQVSTGNITKNAVDVRLGQVLYDKYINIDESKLSDKEKKLLKKQLKK